MASQLVQTKGHLHGLPTYPDEPQFKDLTAVVTGANGISGYHMVRILASAPERWSRIICLSRRPPPDNFFEDLGDGAARVEHISVDFLATPSEISDQLKTKVDKVYVYPFIIHDLLYLTLSPCQRSYLLLFIYANSANRKCSWHVV
jgi:hypothetical protein